MSDVRKWDTAFVKWMGWWVEVPGVISAPHQFEKTRVGTDVVVRAEKTRVGTDVVVRAERMMMIQGSKVSPSFMSIKRPFSDLISPRTDQDTDTHTWQINQKSFAPLLLCRCTIMTITDIQQL